MSEAEGRQERIEGKLAQSQERLQRESKHVPPFPRRETLPDAYPPADYRSLAGEYPWLSMAAGLGAGMLVGALLPRGFGKGFGRRTLGALALAAELGLSLKASPEEKRPENRG